MRHLARFAGALGKRGETGLLRTIPPADAGGIDFAGNDYLGLSRDSEVVGAACAATLKFGVGARASRLVSGGTRVHEELEGELARFKGAESALLFPSGFQGAAGFIAEAAEAGDTIYLDRLVHSCLASGAAISGARRRVFRHNDAGHLDDLLRRDKTSGVRWVVVDGVYSMDGDVAPLPELLEVCGRRDAVLVLDEAHATGTLGATGRGTFEHFGIAPEPWADRVVTIATLGKALGAQGGAILGPRVVRDWCANFVRSQVYSTALSPVVAAAALAALRIVEREPARVAALAAKSALMRAELRARGLPMPASPSPIVPVIVGDEPDAMSLSAHVLRGGFRCGAVRPPTVPRGTSRLRITVSAARTDEEILRLAGAVGSWFFENRCRG